VKRYLLILSSSSLFFLLAMACMAQNQPNSTAASSSSVSVPRLVKFSGNVKNDASNPKSGIVGITFALYKEQQGGAPLWLETQNVQADSKGNYTVLLGSTNADGLPTEMFTSNEARWLGVQIEGQEEQPRTLLVSAPYALKAGDAETLGGQPLSAFQLVTPQGSVGPAQPPVAAASQKDQITCASGTACKDSFVPLFTSNGGSAKVSDSIITQSQDTVNVNGGVNGQTGFFESNNNGAIFQVTQASLGAGTALSGYAEGTSGIGVQGTGVTGVEGSGLGNNGTGVSGEGNTGVFGNAPATTGITFGVLGQIASSNVNSAGVEGIALGNGQTSAVYGLNFSSSDFSTGVSGSAQPSGGVGMVVGVEGYAGSLNGAGVLGFGWGDSQTGRHFQGCCAFGVWGDTGESFAKSFGSAGLIGTADDARAIFLENNSPSNVPTAFIQQDAPGNVALQVGGVGHYCTIDTNANLICNGTASTTAAVDAGQRQVSLYAVQSPQNWFEDFGSGQLSSGSGRVTLDSAFAQTVNLDSDYHVFLTPAGDCRGLYVTNKTVTGFEVHETGGGQSSVSFDYRIVALRRGFENVRLADITEQLKKLNALQPKPVKGHRMTIPRPVPAAGLATSSGTLATTPSTR
jgi:hypothetical protein